ncbi:MAG: ATP-binding protein [Reinekea sp.]
MAKSPSIGNIILTRALPTLSVVAIGSILLLVVGIYVTTKHDLDKQHTDLLKSLETAYNHAVDDQLAALQSMASQPFLKTALSKPSSMERQLLDSHIQSLHFGQLKYAELSIFDENGTLISNSDPNSVIQEVAQQPWLKQVYQQKTSFHDTSGRSPSFIVPVLENNQVIGAVLSRINNLNDILHQKGTPNLRFLIIDSERYVLFTSDFSQFPPYSTFDLSNIDHWESYELTMASGMTAILLISENANLKEFFRLSSFAVVSLILVVAASILGARVAGQLATETVRHFLSSVQLMNRTSQFSPSPESEPQAKELNQLLNEFNLLLQKLSEARLSEARFSALMNSLNDLLVVFDLNGTPILLNRAFERFLTTTGIRKDNMLTQVFYGKNKTELLDCNQELSSIEKRYLSASQFDAGVYLSIKWSRYPLLNDAGDRLGVIFVGLDTTASHQLKTEIQLKDAAIDGADSGIFIIEIKRDLAHVIYANKGVTKLTDIQPEEFLVPADKLMARISGSNELFNRIRAATLRHQSTTETFVRTLADGSERHLEISLSQATLPIATASDYYLGIMTDVTEKAMTEQLLLEAKAKAEESTQMKSAFLASMSHEIRTPMNGVIGMLDILNDSSLNAEQKKHVEIAQSSAELLLTIINDILDFSKVEAGKLIVDQTDFNLSEMLEDFIHTMLHLANNKHLELVLKQQNVDKYVTGDPGRLRQILTNLVNNAIKFTEQGQVIVDAKLIEKENQPALFRAIVKDSGIGISVEKQAQLFDPFTQVDSSPKRTQQGTGLGLAIVKQLIDTMGGKVWLDSLPGKGSTFGFQLPLPVVEQAQINQKEGDAQTQEPEETEFTFDQPHRVLLVEDNLVNQMITKRYVEKFGLDAVIAGDGQDAINTLRKLGSDIDLIIMDCQMPLMDGFEATQRIRQGEAGAAHTNTPIIAMTANAMKGDREYCLEVGMDDYISKPLRKAELSIALNTWLNRISEKD